MLIEQIFINFEPNVDRIDIHKFYGFNKNEVLKYYIYNKKDINFNEKEVIFNETKQKFNDMLRNDYINNTVDHMCYARQYCRRASHYGTLLLTLDNQTLRILETGLKLLLKKEMQTLLKYKNLLK